MALVVFLRGCNVGGKRIFRPTRLAEQLQDYGVVNIGAAGTFVIRKRTSHARLRADLRRRLPFETEIIICEAISYLGSIDGLFGVRVTTRNWNTITAIINVL